MKMFRCVFMCCLFIATPLLPLYAQTSNTPSPNTSGKRLPLSPSITRALNQHVEYINEAIKRNRKLQSGLTSYQKHANFFLLADVGPQDRGSQLVYTNASYKIPDSLFNILKRDEMLLPPGVRPFLRQQAKDIHQTLQEIKSTHQKLSAYVSQRTYHQDQLKGSDEALDQFAMLFRRFDRQKRELYKELVLIYERYQPLRPKDTWRVNHKRFVALTDSMLIQLSIVDKRFHGMTENPPHFSTIKALGQSLKENKRSNLGRIRNGNTEDAYDWILHYSQTMVDQIERLLENEPYDILNYEQVIYSYNEVINFSNGWVEIAPVPLLKQMHHTYPFKRVLPAIPEPTSVQEIPLVDMKGFAPSNLVLLLDVSGSMADAQQLTLIRKSLLSLIPHMRQEDQVSLIVFASRARKILPTTSFKDQQLIENALSKLRAGGNSKLRPGIKLAYATAEKNFAPSQNNRVLLLTDGNLNITPALLKLAEKYAAQDIPLTVFDFGRAKNPTRSLVSFTQLARGNYAKITPQNLVETLIQELQAVRVEP